MGLYYLIADYVNELFFAGALPVETIDACVPIFAGFTIFVLSAFMVLAPIVFVMLIFKTATQWANPFN